MLLGACDGPTTLAKGEDVEFRGTDGLAGQTLNVTAEEEDGEVTGEFRVTENVIKVECADTDTDGVVILGGKATAGPDLAAGDLLALIIREGDPDSVALVANVNAADKKEGKEVTLKGKITCAKCDLKVEGQTKCATVIQVEKGGKKTVYYFDADSNKKYHGDICKEAKEGTVTGTTGKDGKKNTIKVTELKYSE